MKKFRPEATKKKIHHTLHQQPHEHTHTTESSCGLKLIASIVPKPFYPPPSLRVPFRKLSHFSVPPPNPEFNFIGAIKQQ